MRPQIVVENKSYLHEAGKNSHINAHSYFYEPRDHHSLYFSIFYYPDATSTAAFSKSRAEQVVWLYCSIFIICVVTHNLITFMIIARIQIGGLLHIQTTIKGPKFSYSKKCIAKLITYLAWGNVYLSGDLQWKGIKLDNETHYWSANNFIYRTVFAVSGACCIYLKHFVKF